MHCLSNALSLFIIIALVSISMQWKSKEQVSLDLNESELYELARAIYHEARGEDALG